MTVVRATATTATSPAVGVRRAQGRPAGLSRIHLVGLLLVLALEGASAASIFVQIGAIQGDLPADPARLHLVVGAFLLSYAGLFPAALCLARGRDRRTLLLVGVVVFALGCLLCAVASSVWVLVLGRSAQGAGAAISAPAAMALLVAGPSRSGAWSRPVVVYGALGAAGFVLGLVLTGGIVDRWGWRASCAAWVPVAFGVVAVVCRLPVPRSAGRGRVDLFGVLLLITAMVVEVHLVGGLTRTAPAVLVLETALVVGLVGTLMTLGGVPLFPEAALHSRRVLATGFGLAAVCAAVTAALFLLSATVGDALVARVGAATALGAGAVIVAASLAALANVGLAEWSTWAVLAAMVGVGSGLSISWSAASIAMAAAVPDRHRDGSTGLVVAAAHIGGALGPAVVTATMLAPGAGGAGSIAGLWVCVGVVGAGVLGALATGLDARSEAPTHQAV